MEETRSNEKFEQRRKDQTQLLQENKTDHRREEMFALIRDDRVKTRDNEEIRYIASKFYVELLKNDKTLRNIAHEK